MISYIRYDAKLIFGIISRYSKLYTIYDKYFLHFINNLSDCNKASWVNCCTFIGKFMKGEGVDWWWWWEEGLHVQGHVYSIL